MSLIGTILKLSASQHMMQWLEFSAAPPPMADGNLANAQCDGRGALLVSAAPLNDDSDKVATRPKKAIHYATPNLATGEATKVLQASAGAQLIRVTARNKNAAVRYLQVFNLAALPAPAAIPMEVITLPLTSTTTFAWPAGLEGLVGMTLAISSVETSYDATGVTLADHWLFADYYP